MCVVSKPKIPKSAADNKDPAVLRNPFLDGLLGNIAALRNGRNSLRIDLLDPLAIPGGSSGGGGRGGGIGGGTSTGTGTSSGGSGGGSTSTSGGGGSSTGGTPTQLQ